MISNDGAVYAKRFLAGMEPSLGKALAFGIGNQSEQKTDTRLQFETGRVPVEILAYDFVDDYLVFKAVLPEEFEGSIYELAVYSRLENPSSGQYASKMIASMGEEWTGASYTTVGTRIGSRSVALSPAAGQTSQASLENIVLDLSGFSGQDIFSFAFDSTTDNGTVNIDLMTDDSNYFTFPLGLQLSGYKILNRAKSTAVATGVPDWSEITEIRVRVTAPAGASATIAFDGIRVEDADTVSPDYVMVARRVMANPYVKLAGTAQEIEFALDINIT